MNESLEIWTDGACSILTNKGGWAYFCPEYSIKVCGDVINTTNNKMEMKAVFEAMRFIHKTNIQAKNIVIYTDSLYVVHCFAGDYKIIKNQSFWKEIFDLREQLVDRNIEVAYTKGHADDINNNCVDVLANFMSKR